MKRHNSRRHVAIGVILTAISGAMLAPFARGGDIAGPQGSALSGRDRPRRPTNVDHHRIGEHDSRKAAIACVSLHCLARDRHPVLEG